MFSRFRDRYESDPLLRIFGIGAIILLAALGLPRIWPYAASGINCTSLPRPFANAYNQSVLAATQQSTRGDESLQLEIVADKTSMRVGETLTLYVRFVNSSVAPITLYLTSQSAVLRYNEQESGILISVINQNNQPLGENTAFQQSPPQYDVQSLGLLAPRSRCQYQVDLPWIRLQAIGLQQGQYRLTAVYRNATRGGIAAPANLLTPTPIFADQGVWAGRVQSNDVILTVNP